MKMIKALGDWEIEVLGVPYGSPEERDSDNEYFTPDTKLHEDKYGLPPVVVYHGLDKNQKPTKPEYIGRTLAYEDKADGRWYRAVLDKGNEYAAKVWEAVQKGTAAVSSGASHLARVATDGMIAEWPVTELSIWDNSAGTNPQANPKAIAMPAKYQVHEHQNQEAEQENGGAGVGDNNIDEVLITNDVPTKNKEQQMTEQVKEQTPVFDSAELIAGIGAEFSKAVAELKEAQAQEMKAWKEKDEPIKSGGVAVVGDEADRALEGNPFKTPGEFYMEVKNAAQGRTIDERIKPLKSEMYEEGIIYKLPKIAQNALKAPSGLSEVVPADGGFLVGTQRQPGVGMRSDSELGQVWNRAANVEIGPNSNGLTMNMVDETSRANGSRWGGVLGYWLAEAAEKTASKPTFDQLEAKLKKVAALLYATDEVLQDATALASLVNMLVPSELAFQKDDKAINGSGVGVPLGILNSPALVTVAKETEQAAATIVAQNIINMYSRREGSPTNYVWFVNQEVEPQLHQLNLPVGTGGALVYMPPGGLSASPYGSLYGRPVIPIEQASALGTVGDIMFVNMQKYLTISKGGVQSAESIHVRFIYDESVFRFVERVDGMPMVKAPLTPFKGSNTRSPFVALATRS